MKYGILGGTFDPPHNGHLKIAAAARSALGLAQIVFIPAGQPPHKLDDPVSPAATRLAMLELALARHPDFVISRLELLRAGPSYTVDTLRELHQTLGDDAEIYFIMGMDSLQNFHAWHQPQEIVKLCKLAVLRRPGFDVDLDTLEKQVPGVTASVVIIPGPEFDISASEIRARVRRGESIRGLVPPAVAAFIKTNRLYKNGAL
ncbi:MAG: nicotinate-nucleotide adenylyltransferase [Anaerolineae bacterium]|nr:nicotinate-nucleotide adenylyltransferase [Anaerolineae bacterium]